MKTNTTIIDAMNRATDAGYFKPSPEYTVGRYGKEWGVFSATSRCYVLFGSKKEMDKRAKELNAAK